MIGETILVIDTDTETTQKIIATLEAEDYLVFTAPSGDVGITMAKKINPSLIFVNPALAGTSGLEVCKTLHGMELFKNVPIIVLSAFEGAMDPRYTSIYGIVDSLRKPFSPEELIAKTKNVLAKKPFEAQSVETAEEYVDLGEGEETIAIEEEMPEIREEAAAKEEIPEIHKEVAEDIDISDKTAVKPMGGDIEEEKTEHVEIPREEPEETMVAEKTYVLKKNIRRRGMKNRLLMPVVVGVVIIILGVAGFVLYKKDLLPWIGTKVQKPVATKPAKPIQQQAAQVSPSQEQQKPQQPAAESKPAPVPAPKPAPTPAPKPEVKPAGKAIYSVQIGAFKSEANATALTKQYKEKGYEAFTHKAQKDKEIIYRVLIGKFENNKEVSTLAASISTKEKIKTVIFKE